MKNQEKISGYPTGELPVYQPETPQKKKGHKMLWIILIIVSLIVILGVVIAMAGSGGKSSETSQPKQTVTAQAKKPGMPQPTVGIPYEQGDWTVTVNAPSIGQPTDFAQPKAGDQFVVIPVTLKNNTGQTQTASSLLYWSLVGTDGVHYTQSFLLSGDKPAPDGKVANGQTISGDLVYEVPASMHSFELQFTPDQFSQGLWQWSLKI